MVVRIRLARHGKRNNPFYHIVAIRDKAAREARPIEKLGEYDPIPRPAIATPGPVRGWQANGPPMSEKEIRKSMEMPVLSSGIVPPSSIKLEKRIEWNVERIQYWLGVGAQPSKPVAKLLDNAGLIPEGKWFKGMYRSPMDPAMQHLHRPPRSKILRQLAQSSTAQVKDVAESIEKTVDGAPEAVSEGADAKPTPA